MKKIQFPKQTVLMDVTELGIDYAEGVKVEFWANPSKKVMKDILAVILPTGKEIMEMDSHERDRMERDYYKALCELIVETNIESLNFDSPENAEMSFEAGDVPLGFTHQVIVAYIMNLMEKSDALKKVLALSFLSKNSGKDKKNEEVEEMAQNQEK